MDQHTLNVLTREATGRGVARRLRSEGKIPANISANGSARSISVSAVDFRALNREIGGGAALVELVDEKGEKALSLIQDVQHHATKDTVEHIDFQEVARGHSFVTHVPVQLVNQSEATGVKNEGGVLDHKAHEVEIRCRPSKLPDHVEVDVIDLSVGGAIHISDLPVIEGVEYLGDPSLVIVSVQAPTVTVESTEDAEPADAAEVPATKVKSDDAE
ncbi:MAG: 50S ribosomal protein L25 [Verrucomicrobiota bacterium]